MATDNLERRSFLATLELRAAKKGSGPGTLTGYAALFDSLSEDLGGFREKIQKSAFTSALQNNDVRALRNHEPDILLGRLSSGTLKLEENSKGLRMEIFLPDTSFGWDTATMVRRGDLSGASFSFFNTRDSWEFDGPIPIRTLVSLELSDVSVVTYPAYAETSVAIRSLTQKQPIKVDPLARWKNRQRLAELF